MLGLRKHVAATHDAVGLRGFGREVRRPAAGRPVEGRGRRDMTEVEEGLSAK
jgi:hypothetical protein